MINLVYVSSAVKLFSDEELLELLRRSRENNEKLRITGLLLYHDGNFMQLLEGPEEPVMALYKTIRNDPRHKDVTTLIVAPIEERHFADWAMGFQNVDKMIQSEAGVSQFLNTPLTAESFMDRPTRALVLLNTFRDMIRN